jgi:hypothetical protein
VRQSVLVALLVVLAGCAGLTGTPTPTVTPAPVPAAEQQAVGDTPLPPGVTAGGVTDVRALSRAHTDAALERSYRLSVVTHRDTLDGYQTDSFHVRVGNATTYLSRSNVTNGTRLETYAEDGLVLVRYDTDPPRYDAQPHGVEPPSAVVAKRTAAHLRTYLAVERAAVSATSIHGTDVVRIEGEKPRRVSGTIGYTVVAYVEPSGFVRSLHVEFDCTTDRPCSHVTVSIRHDAVNQTTVSRPPWYDEAIAATNVSST